MINKSHLTFAAYDDPAVNWTRTSYVQPQVHLYDRYLYNDTTHEWTVPRYLADLKDRYGGIDSVLIWPTYPNIGIDARNQFDFFRAVPGGIKAIGNITKDFHAAGVKVLWGYNPWDQNLNDEGEPHWTTMARLLKETGGDGFNGDTMNTMYKEFWQAGVDVGHKIVGEMEGGGYRYEQGWKQDDTWESTNWNTVGWGYYHTADGGSDGMTHTYWYEPPVDKAKWLDPRGRRMTHVNDRWSTDRTTPMQFAHFNGVGYESWENVWGIFMHFTERDGEALRRLQTIWRWLGPSEFTQNYHDWFPYAPEASGTSGVFASRWQHVNGNCAWTVVNRDDGDRVFSLDVSLSGCRQGHLYDLYAGKLVDAASQLKIESHGYGAYVMVDALPAGLSQLLSTMQLMSKRPLRSYDTLWAPLHQTLVNPGDPAPLTSAPKDMVLIPRTKYLFQTGGVEIEGGCDASQDTFDTGNCCDPQAGVMCPGDEKCNDMCAFPGVDDRGVDVQYPWEPHPRRFHSKTVDVGPFYIDVHLVTNADFGRFLNSTGYVPRDPHNFLKDAGRLENNKKPVTWIGLSEARAYCSWAGKRLPHAYEWQLAAQSTDGRTYPWGSKLEKDKFPTPARHPADLHLPDVGSYPSGNSPYGVTDMVGLVWQFTDEFEDAHTRGVVLKGSSMFNPVLSGEFPALPQPGNWYFPQAKKVTQHNRLLVMDDSYERAATLGFRCVATHPGGSIGPTHLHESGAAERLVV